MGWAGQSGEGAASALQEAVEHHRQQLERLAMAVARIERIEREVAELNSERASAVQEYEKLYADLTSGRAAGDAIASLGLTVASKASGRGKKSNRSPRRAAAKVDVHSAARQPGRPRHRLVRTRPQTSVLVRCRQQLARR